MKNINELIKEKYYRKLNIPSGDLRISVTDYCNMRCNYCHNEGQDNNKSELSTEDIIHIISSSLKYGVNKVRLTGGEPLLHPDIVTICQKIYHETGIKNLGINTNGINKDVLFEICSLGILNQVVVGIDYYDSEISKDSDIGVPSSQILNTVKSLKENKINTQIAMVYLGNYHQVTKMIQWCFEHNVLLKIIEFIGHIKYDSYQMMIEKVVNDFNLNLGVTADLDELYAYDSKQNKILFFQSHCNRNECSACKNLHMRVTSRGFAKPCIMRNDTTISLLEDFDKSMKIAIANLGNPPGKPVK
jgi:cyclic pyranopterin phosphate synthase